MEAHVVEEDDGSFVWESFSVVRLFANFSSSFELTSFEEEADFVEVVVDTQCGRTGRLREFK